MKTRAKKSPTNTRKVKINVSRRTRSLVKVENTFDPGGQGQDSKADHFKTVPEETHEDEEDNHHSFSGQGAEHEERQAEAEAPRMKNLSEGLERDPELDKTSQLHNQRQ